MKQLLTCVVAVFSCCAGSGSVAAVAQVQTTASKTSQGATEAAKPEIADGASSPNEMGNRRPLYRLRKSDVIGMEFTFAAEFNQTLNVQADGLSAKGAAVVVNHSCVSPL